MSDLTITETGEETLEIQEVTDELTIADFDAEQVVIAETGVTGPRGPVGIGSPGPPGPPGVQGPAGNARFWGDGPPGVVVGASPSDEYVDRLTGDIYRLQ